MELPTIVKITLLPKILEAAQILYDCEIIKVPPHECVKIFVRKNPDINKRLEGLKP